MRMPIAWHYGHLDAFHLRGNGPQRSLDKFGYWTGGDAQFLPDDSVQEVIRIGQKAFYPRPKIREGGMRGGWFFHAPGSNIFMDLGKTFHATSRADFVRRHAIPIKLPPSYPFALDYTNHTCATAQAHGYDTVQFLGKPLEIVNCQKAVTDQAPRLDDTCAWPLKLWKDAAKRAPCDCNNSHSLLNCGP